MKYQLLGLVIRTSVILHMYVLDQKLEPSLNRMGKAIGFTGVYSHYTASIGKSVCYRFPQVVDRTESDRACWVFAEVNFGQDNDGSISEERSDLQRFSFGKKWPRQNSELPVY